MYQIDLKNEEYYKFKIKKDVIENAWNKGKDLLVDSCPGLLVQRPGRSKKNIAPNLGIGAATGKAVAEVIRHTGAMAPAIRFGSPRIGMVGKPQLPQLWQLEQKLEQIWEKV